MTDKEPDVKPRTVVEWLDAHPRTGWYLVAVLTANFALNLFDALDIDPLWFVR